MALWLVRAGRHGEQEQAVLKNSRVAIGWNELPNLLGVSTREKLRAIYEEHYPGEKKMEIANKVGQIWAFLRKIEKGDLVVLPLKLQSAIAIGTIEGPYEYKTDLSPEICHTRLVKWIRTDLPRTAFDQDLLFSFGAFMTVCSISRNNAEARVRAVIEGKKVPVPAIEADEELQAPRDIDQMAQDQIHQLITEKFKGHNLARLVDALLRAQGYETSVSPPGPDGGVDILAGKGQFGFDSPYLCVQVKSQDSPLDVNELKNLQATVENFGGERGLMVAWGGYKKSVPEEAKRRFFKLRLWTAKNLIDAILENYDNLPADIQAELPLKRIWVRVWED